MALLERQLVVKKSTLPNAGKGLFTRKSIPAGTKIVEYKGTITRWKDVNHDEGRNKYIYYINRNHVIDAAHHLNYLARYANDALGLARVKGITNNATYKTEGLKAYIFSTRDIPAGGEILVGYGKEYWDVVRYNQRLDRKKIT